MSSNTAGGSTQSTAEDGDSKGVSKMREALSEALECLDREIPEHFHHYLTDTTAPNPGLEVAGVGSIRLPLSSHDAQAIMGLCNNSKGTAGPGYCELEPSVVTFRNSNWERYVNKALTQRLSQAFMLPKYVSDKMTYRLAGLLVTMPVHNGQSTQHRVDLPSDSDNTLAHVLVALPSQFDGGQVRWTYPDSKEAAVDLSHDAEFNTYVLAWYTDIDCTLDPLVSGHRVFLEYALEIHNLRSIRQQLPSLDDLVEERRQIHDILSGWANGDYESPSPPVMIHAHSTTARSSIRSTLLPVAEELGFLVYSGRAELHLEGKGDDTQDAFNERRRAAGYYDDDYDYDDTDFLPPMDSVHSRTMSVMMEDCLNGGSGPWKLQDLELAIEDGCLTYDFFCEDEDEPDDAEYTGYHDRMEAGDLDQWYRCDVIIILQAKDEIQLQVAAKGVDWAAKELQVSPGKPLGDARRLCEATVSQLASTHRKNLLAVKSYDKAVDITGAAKTLYNLSLTWKDLGLLLSALPFCGFSADDVGKAVASASDVFHARFIELQHGLENIIEKAPGTVQRLELLNALYDNFSTLPRLWYTDHVTRQLSEWDHPSKEDVPAIIETTKRFDIGCLGNILIPALSGRSDIYAFFLALLDAVTKMRDSISQHERAQHLGAIRACFLAAGKQWDKVSAESSTNPKSYWDGRFYHEPPPRQPTDVMGERICSLVRLALSKGELTPSLSSLLDTFLPSENASPAELENSFKDIYIPLIPHLIQVVAHFLRSPSSPPFDTFLRSLIQIYLDRVLASEDAVPPLKTSSVACRTGNCEDCKLLDKFLNNSDPHISFSVNQQRRNHLENQIRAHRKAAKKVTTQTITGRTPYTLVVRKTAEVLQRHTWEGRRAAARAFLGSIGDSDVLRAIMGRELYDEACKALSL